MAKELRCSDLGGTCSFVIRGDSENVVLNGAVCHMGWHALNVTPEWIEKARSAVRNV